MHHVGLHGILKGTLQGSFIIWTFIIVSVNISHQTKEGEEILWATCQSHHYQEEENPPENSVHEICDIGYLTTDVKFSNIQSENILALTLQCSQVVPSSIQPGMLSHLTSLRKLWIRGCLLYNLLPGTLKGLGQLDLFLASNPDTESSATKATNFSLSPQLLDDVPLLEILDLSFSGLRDIPPEFLCKVSRLKAWSVSNNYLTSVDEIGCGRKNLCCRGLQSLNMSHNSIAQLSALSLKPMTQMQLLDFSFNVINKVEEGVLNNMTSLLFCNLRSNRIRTLPDHLFNSTPMIVVINLSHNQLEIIPDTLFYGLHDLIAIFLNGNKISFVPTQMLLSLKSLKYLDLSDNRIQALPDNIFRMAPNLLEISLAMNQISSLEHCQIQLLQHLQNFNISQNKLKSIGDEVFNSSFNLQILDLSGNLLQRAPVVKHLKNLVYVSLHSNSLDIMVLGNWLNKAVELNLGNNSLTEISLGQFDTSSLQALVLSVNKLQSLDWLTSTFGSLSHLLIDHINITNLTNKLITATPNLKHLTVSHNAIDSEFDFSYSLPASLETLDISYNFIKSFSNVLKKPLRLRTLTASHNEIIYLQSKDLPTSLAFIDLSHNILVRLGVGVFSFLPNLQFVNLQHNNLTILQKSYFHQLPPFPPGRPLPVISLEYNSFTCECHNSWLKSFKPDKYLPILKINSYCTLMHERMKKFHYLLEVEKVQTNQFLCTENQNDCVPTCRCYFSFDKNIIQTDCGGHRGAWNITRFPEATTHLFLDDVQPVPYGALQAEYNRTIALFLNNSHIDHLVNYLFAGFPKLEELHLENNDLQHVKTEEFAGLQKLKLLFLHNNHLLEIQPLARTLTSLENLTIHDNQLTNLNREFLPESLRFITLRNNSFNCSCDVAPPMQQWVLETALTVLDSSNVFCRLEGNSSIPLFSFNDSACFALTTEIKALKNATLIVLLAVASFLLAITSVGIGIYRFREEILVLLYARYGIRLFHKNEMRDEKTYDAYICYSVLDEDFVVDDLVPGLDAYRLCLHERDFPVGGYIVESILHAVQKSCRTILVLSPHFVKSEWCRFEFKSAHQQALQDRCCRLILIVLEDVAEDEMEPELKAYLRTNTYLKWEHPYFWEKLRYALPDPTIVDQTTETTL